MNRRIRRRVSGSKRVLVHLFSGVQSWKGVDGDVVLEIERDKGRDLMNETLFIYLLGLILQGKVKGIVGGPPCATFSRARSRSPGPRVIRGREGHERFGLQGLSLQEYDQLERDNVLILRMMFLVQLAQKVSIRALWPLSTLEIQCYPEHRLLITINMLVDLLIFLQNQYVLLISESIFLA